MAHVCFFQNLKSMTSLAAYIQIMICQLAFPIAVYYKARSEVIQHAPFTLFEPSLNILGTAYLC